MTEREPEPAGVDASDRLVLEDEPDMVAPSIDLESRESLGITYEEEADLVEAEPVPMPVSYTGQDFDVSGLVQRLDREDILVPTFGHDDNRIEAAGFQRSFVWVRPQMDRFIESVLLGYPVPGIFLVRQQDRRYLVLDGQQRLRTLQYFTKGVYQGKEFALRNVADSLKGLTYETLPEEMRRLFDDAFIQATIVATDDTSESLEAIYQIFERVNAGGTPLTPHEIRVALFAGEFIDYLEDLNQEAAWRDLYGKPSPRLRDQELVLRIVAMYESADDYRRPLKTFLNDFVGSHRSLDGLDGDSLRTLFSKTSGLLADSVGWQGLRLAGGNQVNAALTEATYIGLMRRLDSGPAPSQDAIHQAIDRLHNDPDLIAAVSRATADEENVRTRLAVATQVFAEA